RVVADSLPLERHPVPEGDDQQSLPHLGHPVPPRLHNPRVNRIAFLFELFDDRTEDEHFAIQGEIGHVLHEDGARPSDGRDLEERTPQISSFVIRVSLAELDTVPDHRAAGPGERLARRSAGDDLYTSVLDQLADALDHIWVGEIPVEREPGEVVRM